MWLIWNGYYNAEPEDAPVQCWCWLAEYSQKTGLGSEYYHMYWSLAFERLDQTTDPALAHNVIVATLGGLLFQDFHCIRGASIHQCLEALRTLHRQEPLPEKELAALRFVEYVYRGMEPKHLTAADRLAIETALTRLDKLSPSASPGGISEAKAPGTPPEPIAPVLLKRAEAQLRSLLGEPLWARLSAISKEEFTHGEFYYMFANMAEGERGDFNSFVSSYSRGLLAEIQESIRGPLARDESLTGEFRAQFGGTDYPEWGEIIRYLDYRISCINSKLTKALLAQRVQLNRLDELRGFFEKMKRWRDRAAHTGRRVDRESAAVLHDLLIRAGSIQTVVDFFRKPPRR
jgi:hypothetical protein